jgi:transposase InsO family protein
VAAGEVQTWLRQTFTQWGLPGVMRVDNGWPWAQRQDLPTALALWLIGLGVQVSWNPPRSPRANGFVERFNGLLDQWGEPQRCTSWQTWGERLQWLVSMQREHYPACQGHTRQQAYPTLTQARLPYTAPHESAQWDVQRVRHFLAHQRWTRVVAGRGQVTVYGRKYSVQAAHAHQRVGLRFDEATVEWVFSDQQGHEIVRYPAPEISAERILSLSVSQPKPKAKAEADKPHCDPAA